MKKLLVTLLLIALFQVPALTTLALGSQDLAPALDSAVSEIVAQGKVKGAVISIVKEGEILLSKGYGYADEYHNIPADGERTAFRIGSLSKTFVAVAALALYQAGQLDLHTDISGYLEPAFPKLTYPVTMHQLLTHTAGFEEVLTGMVVRNVSQTEPLGKSVVKYLPAQVSRPGEVISYSNYGIALAAYVVESASGQDFADYCREQIFLPLGMNRTTFKHMHDTAYVSKPYLANGQETLEPYINLYPEGSAVSTAEDMARYIQWLLGADPRILSPEVKEMLFEQQFTLAEEIEGIGYVWNRKIRNGSLYYDKKGETLHFYTRVALYPDAKTGVFLSFNTYLPESEITAIMALATDLVYGQAQVTQGGTATLDIRGSYVNNWSSFHTPERILSYLIPGKIVTITGNEANGYSLNGEKLCLIGDDTYTSPLGVLKFLDRNGDLLIATESGVSYSKLPIWQTTGIQILCLALFILGLLLLIGKEVVAFRKQGSRIPLLCALIQLLAFSALAWLMYHGITNYSLVTLGRPLAICGVMIIGAGIIGIVHTIRKLSKGGSVNLILSFWNLASLLFPAWLVWMNIL